MEIDILFAMSKDRCHRVERLPYRDLKILGEYDPVGHTELLGYWDPGYQDEMGCLLEDLGMMRGFTLDGRRYVTLARELEQAFQKVDIDGLLRDYPPQKRMVERTRTGILNTFGLVLEESMDFLLPHYWKEQG